MFGGSTTLNTKPNPFDDDDSDDDGGEGMDAGGEGIAMFMKGGDKKGNESKPNPFDDSDSEDDGIMTDSLIKAGQDTAQSSPDRSSSLGKDNNSPSSLGNASAGNRVGPFNSPNNDNDEYNSNEEEEDEGPLTPQDIEEWHSNSQKGSPPDDDNAYHTADEGEGDGTKGKRGEKKGYYNLSKPNEHSQFMSNQTGSGLSSTSNNGGDTNKLSYVSEKSKESSDDSLNILTHRTASSINYGQNNTDTSGNNNESRRYNSTKSSNISGIIDTDLTTGISRGVEEGEEQYASMQELIDDEQRSRASFTTNHRRRGKCGWCIDSTIGMKSTKRRKISLCLILLLILGGIIGIVVWLTTTNNKGREESIESNKNKEFESKDDPQVDILDTDGGGGNNGTATDIGEGGGSNEGMKNETNNKDEEGKGTDFDGLDLTFTFNTDMPSLAPSSTTGNRTGEEPTNDGGGEGSNSPTISIAPTPTVMGIAIMDNDDDDIFGTWSDDTSLSASQESNGTDVSIPTTSVNNSTNSSDIQSPEDDPTSYLNVTSLDDDMLSDINVISFNDTTTNEDEDGGSLSPTMPTSPSSSGVGIPSLPTNSSSMGPTSSDMSYSPTISNRPTTSLSIYPPPPSTNTTNLTTTVTESKLQITIPGNLTLSNINKPSTLVEQDLLISILERTIMDVMNQDVLVNEEEVVVKDVVILRINGVDVVDDATDTDVDNVGSEVSGDSPPRVPSSSESSMPSSSNIESDACILCPNGITVSDDYIPTDFGDDATCKELVDITALTFTKDDESCKGSMIMEVYCCPIVQENPCLICGSNGLSIEKEDEMPFIDDGDMMTCKVRISKSFLSGLISYVHMSYAIRYLVNSPSLCPENLSYHTIIGTG